MGAPKIASDLAASPNLIALGKAFRALSYEEMVECAETIVALLPTNKGPIVSKDAMAATLNELLEDFEA